MSYPQTPEEYLVDVIKSAGIDKNWAATFILGIQKQGIKAVGNQLSLVQYKSQPGYANIRTAFNWALSWSKGNPPGASGGGGDPAAIRVAWLELITKGKYDPALDVKPVEEEKPTESPADETEPATDETEPASEETESSTEETEESDEKVVAELPKLPKAPKLRDGPLTSEEATEMGIRGQSSSIDPADGVEPGDYSDVADMMKKGQI